MKVRHGERYSLVASTGSRYVAHVVLEILRHIHIYVLF